MTEEKPAWAVAYAKIRGLLNYVILNWYLEKMLEDASYLFSYSMKCTNIRITHPLTANVHLLQPQAWLDDFLLPLNKAMTKKDKHKVLTMKKLQPMSGVSAWKMDICVCNSKLDMVIFSDKSYLTTKKKYCRPSCFILDSYFIPYSNSVNELEMLF